MIPSGIAATFTVRELWEPIVVTERTGMQRKGRSVVDRLFDRIEQDGDCWLWTRDTWPEVAYMALVGDIPEGLELDHLCRTRPCINPWHLDPVPPRVNNRRGNGITARQRRQTHCLRGHPLSGDNLYRPDRGKRECQTCRLELGRIRRAKARAA